MTARRTARLVSTRSLRTAPQTRTCLCRSTRSACANQRHNSEETPASMVTASVSAAGKPTDMAFTYSPTSEIDKTSASVPFCAVTRRVPPSASTCNSATLVWTTPMEVVLASGSPRRVEILRNAGIPFTQIVSHADEDAVRSDDPIELCMLKAQLKGAAVFDSLNRAQLVIGCDTVGALDGKVVEKPRSRDQCVQYLRSFSGARWTIYTAMHVFLPKNQAHTAITPPTNPYIQHFGIVDHGSHLEVQVVTFATITFRQISDAEIQRYADTREPYDKTGGLAILGSASKWAKSVEGDICGIIGLPVCTLSYILEELAAQ